MSALLPIAAAALLALIYVPVVADLVVFWDSDPNYAHGFLIPFIAGYIAWTLKDSIRRVAFESNAWGTALLAAAMAMRLLGEGVEFLGAGPAGLFVKGLSLVTAVAAVVLMVAGYRVLRCLAPPLLYLLFMVPLPGKTFDMITQPLQSYATSVTVVTLQLLGIPALREGNVIDMARMTLGVVEACSGIRSLLTLLAVAAAIVIVFLDRRPSWLRITVLASAIPIAVATNALRVTATGIMANAWGPHIAEGFYHEFSGWVIFIVAFAILGLEVALLNRVVEAEREGAHTA